MDKFHWNLWKPRANFYYYQYQSNIQIKDNTWFAQVKVQIHWLSIHILGINHINSYLPDKS